MKLFVRILAFILVSTAAVAGNSAAKTENNTPTQVASLPGSQPLPTCNPFQRQCPNMR